MKLKENDAAYKSLMGAFCSLIILVFLTTFSVTKLQTLFLKSDVDILQSKEEFLIEPRDRFTYEDGFFVAAAITEYNNVTESIEREEYGELEIEQYGWGNEDIGYEYGSHKIPNHYCSDSELGLSESEHSDDLNIVYPTVERQIDSVQRFKRKFKCIKPEDSMIWGDYNSEPAM